jgi:small-conductance mechanosensitive channel
MRLKLSWLLAAIASLCLLAMITQAATTQPDPGDQVLKFMDHTIDWYRRITSFCQTPANTDEVLFRDSVQKSSMQVVCQAFAYAENEAKMLTATQSAAAAGSNQQGKLAAAVAAAAQRIAQIQSELDALDAQTAGAAPTSQPAIAAHLDKLLAELNLAKTRQQVVLDFSAFSNDQNASSQTLMQKVADLEGTVPDVAAARSARAQGAPSSPTPTASAPAAQTLLPEQFGVIGLVGQLFTLSHRMSEISDLASQTDALAHANSDLRDPLRTALMNAVHRGDVLAQNHDSDDPKVLADQKQQLDALTQQYTQLTNVVIPLGEQNVVISATQQNLLQWRLAVERDYKNVLGYLVIRMGAMATALLILLGISKAWKEITFRFVSDIRRRRQFLVIRRLVVGCFIILILLGGVVTEFGSLATYAGLLTAGIAVALQTVILSGVAHFFLIGRFGVRVGDRISIGGITGDVIEIGLFRLYLMELGGDHGSPQPTGRVAVFANSVLFQPTAFFKQLPGADYGWHELALTLAPDSDHQLVETQLLKAVEQVYADYCKSIEAQHARVGEAVHVQLAQPRPEGRLRFVDDGLEFVVRYPVELKQAAAINDRITRKLLETIASEPKLKLAAGGAKIRAVEA